MVEITKVTTPADKIALKCPYTMVPDRVVVHNTANDASAMSEISYMLGNNQYTSFHYAVDDYRIVQGIELNRNTWNAADGNGPGNRKGISIEICYSKSGGERFTKAEENGAELVASILKERGWGIDKVTKHQDYHRKYCPHRTLDLGWNRFLDMVKKYMQGSNQPVGWIQKGASWWYRHADGKYTTLDWEQIGGKWYYFDASGWMVTGWVLHKGNWYFCKSSGEMVTGWHKEPDGRQYYFCSPNGEAARGTKVIDGKTYHFAESKTDKLMECQMIE